ncbi:hypothetical protein TWF106_005949 [Orbilia oligospora]|uniref:NAD(P)-binding protein n=1 Tax=Orbilia oligospora TaxID=2813651 RepID=A0A6G1LT11_ORBOL|nr:hypothetical protein TWF788_006831 [Orbilia oligospora]KAF3205939.1 hypothetical protein TWF679_009119 [Orbilia oligospora]KAF3221660.1 hypothetical protein TWF106_005949 [Orbilia oligospora]KAF3225566.1 hypothetical protein TWF191_005266 [Orbilia oligospora]KAF3233683.1 hypothetical protein TWF192_002032 [Orbilia oligospora]
MVSYAITGASRGIGFAFIKHLAQDPSNTVFALVRNVSSSQPLTDLAASHKNVHILKADVTSPEELDAAAAAVSQITGGTLDVLVENAAFLIGEAASFTLTDLVGDPEKTKIFSNDLQLSVEGNILSVVHTTNAFLPLIKKGEVKKILVISTGLADTDAVIEWQWKDNVPYGASKAAVNMVVAQYSNALVEDGVTIVALSPGLVRTQTQDWAPAFYEKVTNIFRKSKPSFEGPLSPEESVRLMLETLGKLTVKDGGKFLSQNGNKDWL